MNNTLMEKLMGPPIGGPGDAALAGEMVMMPAWVGERRLYFSRALIEDVPCSMGLIVSAAIQQCQEGVAARTLEIVGGVRRNSGSGAMEAVQVAIQILVRSMRVEVRLVGEG